MQEKESEALRIQRKRRKRIGRIKMGIVLSIAAWMVISILVIAYLLYETNSLRRMVDQLFLIQAREESEASEEAAAALQAEEAAQTGAGETEALAAPEETEAEAEFYADAPAVGISEEDNLAGPGDAHKVYLTFDDGPSENTDAILDVLSEYGVKASFFVVGRDDEESRERYRRIVDEGHTLGMHSYSNKYSVIYQSAEAFEEDFARLRDYLLEVTGQESAYYRFPGGSSNQISNVPMTDLISFLNRQGIVYYDWNVSAGDAASSAYTADDIVSHVTGDVEKYKTSVVLLHDSADNAVTAEAMPDLIEALEQMGAEILPIDGDADVIQYIKANGT